MQGKALHFNDTPSDSPHAEFWKSAQEEILNHTIYPPIHIYGFQMVSFLQLLVVQHFQYHPDSLVFYK